MTALWHIFGQGSYWDRVAAVYCQLLLVIRDFDNDHILHCSGEQLYMLSMYSRSFIEVQNRNACFTNSQVPIKTFQHQECLSFHRGWSYTSSNFKVPLPKCRPSFCKLMFLYRYLCDDWWMMDTPNDGQEYPPGRCIGRVYP